MAIKEYWTVDGDHIVFLLAQEQYMMPIMYRVL